MCHSSARGLPENWKLAETAVIGGVIADSVCCEPSAAAEYPLALAASWVVTFFFRRVLSRLSRRRPRYFRRDRNESVIPHPQAPNQIMDPREWMRRDNYHQIVQARQRLQNSTRREIQAVHEGDEISLVESLNILFLLLIIHKQRGGREQSFLE